MVSAIYILLNLIQCKVLILKSKVYINSLRYNWCNRRFPTTENEKPIVSIGLSESFLIMLDSSGRIKYYHIDDASLIIDHKSDTTITKMWLSPNGARIVCSDSLGNTFVFLSASDSIIPISGFPASTERVFIKILRTTVIY